MGATIFGKRTASDMSGDLPLPGRRPPQPRPFGMTPMIADRDDAQYPDDGAEWLNGRRGVPFTLGGAIARIDPYLRDLLDETPRNTTCRTRLRY